MARTSLCGKSEAHDPFLAIAPNPFVEDLRAFYADIEKAIPWSDTAPTFQSGIQVCSRFPQDLLMACGERHKLPAREVDFNQLPGFYQDTVIGRLLAALPMRVARLRWMKLMPKSCYSVHQDPAPRLHIPLFTHPQAYFVFPEHGLYHLAVDGTYIVDTRQDHSFMNGSDQVRVHLVGVIA